MSLIACPECGHQVSDRARTCPNCGVDISGNIIVCASCGHIRFADEAQCPVCSRRSAPQPAARTQTTVAEETSAAPQSSPSASRFSLSKTTIVCFIVAVLITLLGVFGFYYVRSVNEQEAYDNAIANPLPPVLRNYLDKYGSSAPDGHLSAVDSLLHDYEVMTDVWQRTIAHPSRCALDSFIQKYPKSIYVAEAEVVIDSLDWLSASAANTLEAYKQYIDSHASGMYLYEARTAYDKLDAAVITTADSSMVTSTLTQYFLALSQNDEELLRSLFASRISSFLNKPNSTFADVIAYMHRLHAAKDIVSVDMHPLGDWAITKEMIDDKRIFKVRFSADHKIHRTDLTKQSFHTYNVEARVTSSGKITELGMERISINPATAF